MSASSTHIFSEESNIKVKTEWGQLLSVKIWTVTADGLRSPSAANTSITTRSPGNHNKHDNINEINV